MFKKINAKNFGLIVTLMSISIGLVGLLYSSYRTYAANLTAGPLTISYSGNQLFNEPNIKPGDVIVKDISVKNNGTLQHSFSISASGVSGSLANVLQIEPRENGFPIWNQTLAQLASLPNGSKVIISSINPGATKNLQIAAIFPTSSGNSYQGQAAVNFNFNMGTESTDQAEPSGLTSKPNNSFGGSILNAITYNPPAATTTTPSGTTGSTGQVAGASTVAGATTVAKELCFWWLVALIILIISLILYHRYQKKEGKVVVWWLWPILFSGVLYIAHFYVDKSYQQTIFCHWFWAIEIVTLIIYFVIDSRTVGES